MLYIERIIDESGTAENKEELLLLFSAVPDSSIMYQNKDSNLISDRKDVVVHLTFINEIVTLMDRDIKDPLEMLLLGDFNIHVNKLDDLNAMTFHNFL